MGWSFRCSKSFGLFRLDSSKSCILPLGALSVIFVVGFAMTPSIPAAASAPVAPVSQAVALITAPVTPTHVAKHHKVKHAIHRTPVTTLEPDDALVAEPVNGVLD
jgi:hypothetical protein